MSYFVNFFSNYKKSFEKDKNQVGLWRSYFEHPIGLLFYNFLMIQHNLFIFYTSAIHLSLQLSCCLAFQQVLVITWRVLILARATYKNVWIQYITKLYGLLKMTGKKEKRADLDKTGLAKPSL